MQLQQHHNEVTKNSEPVELEILLEKIQHAEIARLFSDWIIQSCKIFIGNCFAVFTRTTQQSQFYKWEIGKNGKMV